MDPIDLTNIDKDEKARLLTSYRDGTAGKTIIYVEDRPELGKPTSQLLQAYAPSADLRWVKTADDALELVNEIKAKDPNAPKKMIVITDDDTQSAMDGSHLIKTLSQDKTSPAVQNMPKVLFTGFTVPRHDIRKNVVCFDDEHTALTSKPFDIYVIAKALEVLEKHRGEEAAEVLTHDQKHEKIYKGMSDSALKEFVAKQEDYYKTMRKRQALHDEQGPFRTRSDPKNRDHWEPDPETNELKPPKKTQEKIFAEDRDNTLEAIGFARAELERRAKEAELPRRRKEDKLPGH